MPTTTLRPRFLDPKDGLRLQSGPGRDLVFKVTGDDTGGAFDYFVVEVAPHGGPPLHVHRGQEETLHVLSGRFRVRSETRSRSWSRARSRSCLPASRTRSST